MKQLAEIRSRVTFLFRFLFSKKDNNINKSDFADNDTSVTQASIKLPMSVINLFKNIFSKLQLKKEQPLVKTKPIKKASLFIDGKSNVAALSLILRGVAEILSQKMDLSWKTDRSGSFSYEKDVSSSKGKICYYVTDDAESPHPEILAEEAALAVIDKFDARAVAIHLIYCALVTSLEENCEGNFAIDDKQLLEYTGLIKRRDLSKPQQLLILYNLVRQPAQVQASISWSKKGKAGFTVADIQIWDIAVLREFTTDKNGNSKLAGLKVIGKPGAWTKYFLNNERNQHVGIITKKTVQKLFSIGKQNVGAARLLTWLTFQIKPGLVDCQMGKTLFEIAYGKHQLELAYHDRQRRRQLADDFKTDLNVVQEAGWEVEIETASAWLTVKDNAKRPIGFWDDLLNAKWRFHHPIEGCEQLIPQMDTLNNIQKKKHCIQPPPGKVIREARKTKGWSRSYFASTMGKSISWVDAVETDHRQVSQKDLPKLLNELELQYSIPGVEELDGVEKVEGVGEEKRKLIINS